MWSGAKVCSVNKNETTHETKRWSVVGGKNDTHCILTASLCAIWTPAALEILCKVHVGGGRG